MSVLAPLARAWARERFVSHFMLLALASGTTISMAQLATTLYALKLGASTAQIGVISSMESLGMVFMTLPAGFLVADKNTISGLYNLASMGGSFCGAMGGGALSRYAGLQATFLWWLPVVALASLALWRLRLTHSEHAATGSREPV